MTGACVCVRLGVCAKKFPQTREIDWIRWFWCNNFALINTAAAAAATSMITLFDLHVRQSTPCCKTYTHGFWISSACVSGFIIWFALNSFACSEVDEHRTPNIPYHYDRSAYYRLYSIQYTTHCIIDQVRRQLSHLISSWMRAHTHFFSSPQRYASIFSMIVIVANA